MLNRRQFLSAAAVAPLALGSNARSQTVELKSVKIGSILAGTTVAGELLPRYLQEVGVEAEVIAFPNIVQRMQAVAAGDVQIGYGGINAAIGMAARGFPLALLSNACDGGYSVVARPPHTSLESLKGHKLAVQFGSIPYATLQWKLQQLGLAGQVELLNMNIQDMPVALQRGNIDAMYAIEPYPSMVRINGWGEEIWRPYDTPIGRTNLGFVASQSFLDRYPVLAGEVLKAHIRATNALIADNSEAVDTLIRTLNVSRPVAEMAMENIFFSTDSGPAFQDSVKAMGDMMVDAGLTDKLPDWSTFLQTDFGR